MTALERGALHQYTPCRKADDPEIARAFAEVHAELILMHPFREGNGRLSRLLALLMALQAGLPPLNFSPLTGRGKRVYVGGIHAAIGNDFVPLTAMFSRVIERSRRPGASKGR
jgi:cell filamentation protein